MPHTTPPITFAVVEDDPDTAQLIVGNLEAEDDFRCVLTCPDPRFALRELPALKPKVVLYDLVYEGREEFTALSRLCRALPGSRVLALTSHDQSRLVYQALCAGADGYLLKSDTDRPLAAALREVLADGVPFSRPVARRVLQFFQSRQKDAAESGLNLLTPREWQVLEKIHSGFTNKEIGAALGVSPETIRKEVRSILEKLHAANRAEAAGIFARGGPVG